MKNISGDTAFFMLFGCNNEITSYLVVYLFYKVFYKKNFLFKNLDIKNSPVEFIYRGIQTEA